MGKWLNGCEICNYGLVEEMKGLIKSGISENKAAKMLSEMATRQIGTQIFSPEAIRNRYRLHTSERDPNPKKEDVRILKQIGHNDQQKQKEGEKINNNSNLPLNDIQQKEQESCQAHYEPTIKEDPKTEQCNLEDCRPEPEELGFDYTFERQKKKVEANKPKPSELEVVEKRAMRFSRDLEGIISGEIKDNGTEHDKLTAQSIVRHGPGIIMSYIQLGIDVFKVYEFYQGRNLSEEEMVKLGNISAQAT